MNQKTLWALAAGAVLFSGPGHATRDGLNSPIAEARGTINKQRMSDFVKDITSAQYNGRLAGSPGDVLSRDRIVQQFQQIGLLPAGEDGYLQHFSTTITQPDGEHGGNPRNPYYGQRARTSNIMGMIPGNDPKLSKEVIIISAHRDHLGSTPNGLPYPGANDDALGVAAVLELARAFSQLPGKNRRTLLFVAYGAEEQEYMGSMYHAAHPLPWALNKNILLMISIDMIGRGFDAWTSFTREERERYANRWSHDVYNGISTDADEYSYEYRLDNDDSFDFDNGPFAKIGINNRLIGLADVAHYHKTTDTWANVRFDPAVVVTQTIFDFLWKVDQDPRARTRP